MIDRKRAEELLREGEQKFRLLADSSADVFSLTDPENHRVLYISPAYEKLWGRTCESLYENSSSVFAGVHPDHLKRVLRAIANHSKTGEFDEEFRIVRPDGSIRWVWNRAFAVKNESGQTERIVGVAEDITERKEAKEALRATEERYRTLSELASDAFLAVHPDGQIIHANKAAADMLGYTVEELTGLHGADDIIAPEVFEGTERAWREQLEERGRFLVDTLWVRKDGSRVPVSVSGQPLVVGGQRQLVLIGRDITERERAEEALRASEEMTRTMFDTAAAGIVIADEHGILIEANRYLQEMFGYTEDEFRGMHISDLAHEDDVEACSKQFSELVLGNISRFEMTKRCLLKDGRVGWANIMFSAVRRPDHTFRFGLGMIVDITERKQAEEALGRRERQQAALADLGRLALSRVGRCSLMDSAVSMLCEVLAVDFAKVLQLLPDGKQLLLLSGIGWRDGLIGKAAVGAGKNSQAGFTLLSDEPVIVEDLPTETRFAGPPLLTEHGVVSGISVVIGSHEKPYGVLGTHTKSRRSFSKDDVNFVQAVANVIAAAIERESAEEALRESEDQFRAIFDTAPIGVAIANEHGILVETNGWLQEMFGYADDELRGMRISDLTHPDDVEPSANLFGDLVQGAGSRFQMDKRYLRKDGQVLWANVTISAVSGPDGKFRFGFAMIEDITERKQMEERLRKSREEVESRVELRMRSGGAYGLTFREFTVLHHVAAGKSDKEIGMELGISPLTAQKHVANILSKMEAVSRTEAGVRAEREGLLDELVPAHRRADGGPATPGREDEPPPHTIRRGP